METLSQHNHFLIWEPDTGKKQDTGFYTFKESGGKGEKEISHLEKLLEDATIWQADASRAISGNPVTGEMHPGHPVSKEYVVVGFFVARGSVESTLEHSRHIDWSFLEQFATSPEIQEQLMANVPIMTILPVIGLDASLVTIWQKSEPSELPSVPVELMLEVVNAMQGWADHLNAAGVLLDTGRIDVRFGSFQIEKGTTIEGRRRNAGRMVALGTYNPFVGTEMTSAMEESNTLALGYVGDIGGENVLRCAQGYETCQGLVAHRAIEGADAQPTLAESLYP